MFKNPNSYTGQDSIEISCHGSPFIQQKLLQLFLSQGARMANAGEFTLRAFLNGKLDLSQAEAVADLIASNSALSHQFAMQQMRGGFSTKINQLRHNLINFASLRGKSSWPKCSPSASTILAISGRSLMMSNFPFCAVRVLSSKA